MPYIDSKSDDGKPVKIYYEEYGKGKPVILIHGWPVSHEMWEYQLNYLPFRNLRCVAYDRRGFGKSDRPFDGYDYSTMAADLKNLIDQLGLQDVALVGFSMAGGEVVRYCSRYGTEKISKIMLVSSIAPYLLKSSDHPDGVPKDLFDSIEAKLRNDRPAFLNDFGKHFFGYGVISRPVSSDILDWMKMLALNASPKATIDCLHAFSQTDLRPDIKSIRVPTLIIHGDEDQTVPIDPTSKLAHKLVPNSVLKIYNGSPHGLFITDKEQLSKDIADFVLNGQVSDYKEYTAEELAVF